MRQLPRGILTDLRDICGHDGAIAGADEMITLGAKAEDTGL
jgi:hypothetical protein